MDAVIVYASRSLSKAESHHPAHNLEFPTLKWVVVKKFHEYLYGLTFDVYMNNNPLTYILTTAKLDAALQCLRGLVSSSASRSYSKSGHLQTVGWNHGATTVQTD